MQILRDDATIDEVLTLWAFFEMHRIEQGMDPKKAIRKYRALLIDLIYNDAKWYYVEFTEDDLGKIKVINGSGWEHCQPPYIKDVAKFRFEEETDKEKVKEKLQGIYNAIPKFSDEKKQLIYLSYEMKGPWTIIEGNHRATAMARYYDIEKKFLFDRGYIGIIPNDLTYPFIKKK